MKRVQYRSKYFLTSEGSVKLDDEEIQRMIDMVVAKLSQTTRDKDFTYVATGNTLVVGFVFQEDDDLSDCIEIYVTENYQQAMYFKNPKTHEWYPMNWQNWEDVGEDVERDDIVRVKPDYNQHREV